ncbi:vesicle transport through interaction with t-SNAREs homolog 1B isoform X2 [Chiroxiphia lanceolata]|uniref:vesicle transport through interaction with t-SNAREs homolog 1B isoform X2 n=1 Tax=Chiroxiphia lanceolata TaxID=296741 RepID=UPI0013CE4BB6|nr:vesicle transport through interaction with t-SNAREs homolog 1B isoform X2 [Chiroxiphia lanceolata]
MAGGGAGSSEHLERLHEIFRGLHGDLRGVPERLRGSAAEEKKKLVREFDDKQREANETTNLQSQRVLLLQGTDSLNRASQSIERSHRIAAETDQIGTDIIEELGEQREQLERTKSRLVNTSENLSKSRKILRSMSRRVTTNKLLLSIIIILELAILGGVVYYRFFRNR